MQDNFVDDETRSMIFQLVSQLSPEQSKLFFSIFFNLLKNYENKTCYLFQNVVESPATPFNPENLGK